MVTLADIASRLPTEIGTNMRGTVAAIRAGEAKALDAYMAKSTEETMEHPPMHALLLPGILSRMDVLQHIERWIIQAVAVMNVAHAMTGHQVIHAAEELLSAFTSESIADVYLMLKRGAAGYYGSTFHQMDTSVLMGWMRKHLEEKAYLRERDNANRVKEEKEAPAVDYAAYLERRRQDLKRQQDEESTEIQRKRSALDLEGYKPPTREQILMRATITENLARRYSNLHGGEFRQFFNHEVEGYRIFAKSEEEAREIFEQARKEVDALMAKMAKR